MCKMSFTQEVRNELIEKESKMDKKRSFVRQCFLEGGVLSNPGRTYHLEFTLPTEKIDKLLGIFSEFNIRPKKIARRGQFVVYLKEVDGIADVLNIMGAHKSLLALEGMRVEKSIRNTINRKVNFEAANINKTVSAALQQIEAIKFISESVGLSYLSSSLEEIARIRLANETLSLTEIGALLTPPIGKSGVNHRLRKICKISENLRNERGNSLD